MKKEKIFVVVFVGILSASIFPQYSSADDTPACVDKVTRALRIANTCLISESKITLTTTGKACSLSDIAGINKVWKSSAAEVTIGGALYNCQFSADTTGKIAQITNGCADTYIGESNFDNPHPYDITSGSVTYLGSCTYNIVLNIPGNSITVHGILTPDKKTLIGNFLVSWGGGGSFSAIRLK